MAAAEFVPLLLVFSVFCIAWMLHAGYSVTLGALLKALATGLYKINFWGVRPFEFLANGVSWVHSEIDGVLVGAVQSTRWAFAKVLNFTALLIQKTYEEIVATAEGAYLAIAHVITHDIPLGFKREFAPYLYLLNYLRKEVARALHASAHTAATVAKTQAEAIPRLHITIRNTITPAAKAAAVTIPQAIGIPLPRVGALERDVSGIGKRVEDALRKLSPAALAGVFIGSVLSITGLTWLRCGNVGRTGRAICGLNANVLEGLLAGLLSIFGTIGIVTFAKDVQKVVGDFGSEIGHFWRADVIGTGGDRALGSPGLQ